MSSILDALKKAEQEAGMNDDSKMPWPALSLRPVPSMKKKRWLWRVLGTVAGLIAVVAVYGWLRRPEPSGPVATVKVPSTQSAQPALRVAASDQQAVEPRAVSPLRATAPASPAPVPPSPIRPKSLPSTIQPRAPSASTPPAKIQLPQITPARPRPMAPSPGEALPMATDSGHEIPPAPPETVPLSEPTAPAPAKRDASPQPVPNDGAAIRNDPRIDLQALVWAPEAADRFVVINNRLIKEGGSVDNIVVVQINRDDVLLSEGADRWHQVFQIR